MIFSSTVESFELRVSTIEYSGHFKCRANEAYDSRSESGLAAFNVITNEEPHDPFFEVVKESLCYKAS